MIPCVSLADTKVLNNMKERVKEMRVFGCRLNFWNNVTSNISNKGKIIAFGIEFKLCKLMPTFNEMHCIVCDEL